MMRVGGKIILAVLPPTGHLLTCPAVCQEDLTSLHRNGDHAFPGDRFLFHLPGFHLCERFLYFVHSISLRCFSFLVERTRLHSPKSTASHVLLTE